MSYCSMAQIKGNQSGVIGNLAGLVKKTGYIMAGSKSVVITETANAEVKKEES